MSQFGFFDADRRLSTLSSKGDPLVGISALVPWETFRTDIEAVVLTTDEARKSSAGRKPIDTLVLFRMLVLQSLYNPGLVTKPLWRIIIATASMPAPPVGWCWYVPTLNGWSCCSTKWWWPIISAASSATR